MGKNKLKKFADVLSFSNVYENFYPKDPKLAGKDGVVTDWNAQWSKNHFKNDHPLILELACGGGEYTLGLAKLYPDINFIGVDIKGNRIWKGASKALDQGIENVAFLRTRIEQIDLFFGKEEVDAIWITFPDPFLRNSKSNRRLTSPYFRNKYKAFLKKDAKVHLKTDSNQLYAYSISTILEDPTAKILYKNDNIYRHPLILEELNIKTYYEMMHLERQKLIKYLQFTL
ncbi:MAG: tRNA (guanosine(46)-N7)-methyltransferase TrmB [Bacteroidota bacterium]